MPDSWNRRIDRATALARGDSRASALLTQYAAILAAQRTCYDALVSHGEGLTGSLEHDLDSVRECAETVFATIAKCVPDSVAAGAPRDAASTNQLLRDGWYAPSAPFLARLVLQPYAEALSRLGRCPEGRNIGATPGRATCPFCGGPPQVSVLRRDGGSDGGGRELICALCSTNWALRRILCVHCGEEDEHRLKYFHTPEFDHVRVDACETCLRYLKAVDLSRLGIAVPVVDEVASGALDIWAHEHGFIKVEVNLVGL